MPRSRAIFEDCFAVAGQTLHGTSSHYSLDFHAVHDEGVFPPDVLAARQQRERASLEVCDHSSDSYTPNSRAEATMSLQCLCDATCMPEPVNPRLCTPSGCTDFEGFTFACYWMQAVDVGMLDGARQTLCA